jgi:hypothetical protein
VLSLYATVLPSLLPLCHTLNCACYVCPVFHTAARCVQVSSRQQCKVCWQARSVYIAPSTPRKLLSLAALALPNCCCVDCCCLQALHALAAAAATATAQVCYSALHSCRCYAARVALLLLPAPAAALVPAVVLVVAARIAVYAAHCSPHFELW